MRSENKRERKKGGTWNALSISFRLDRLVCFSQCFYSFGMRRLFFFSPLNSWHFSPLLCYLLIVFYFVFTVGSICLFFFAIDFFIVKWELPGSSESRRRNNKREGRTIHQTYQDYPERKRKQRREGITHIEVEHTAMLHMPLDRNCIDRRPGQLRARLYVTTRSWAEK